MKFAVIPSVARDLTIGVRDTLWFAETMTFGGVLRCAQDDKTDQRATDDHYSKSPKKSSSCFAIAENESCSIARFCDSAVT